MPKNLKNVSKGDYSLPHDGNPTLEEVRTSCLMRIADAGETIAQNYNNLIADRDRYQKWYNEERAKTAKLERRLIALRGVITRQKNNSGK